MDNFTTDQLGLVFEEICNEKLDFAKLQAALVWVDANGKLDKVGKKQQVDATGLNKLKSLGILEVE